MNVCQIISCLLVSVYATTGQTSQGCEPMPEITSIPKFYRQFTSGKQATNSSISIPAISLSDPLTKTGGLEFRTAGAILLEDKEVGRNWAEQRFIDSTFETQVFEGGGNKRWAQDEFAFFWKVGSKVRLQWKISSCYPAKTGMFGRRDVWTTTLGFSIPVGR